MEKGYELVSGITTFVQDSSKENTGLCNTETAGTREFRFGMLGGFQRYMMRVSGNLVQRVLPHHVSSHSVPQKLVFHPILHYPQRKQQIDSE